MEILATMGQLCTERSLESNNPPVKSQKFDHFSLFSDRSEHNCLYGELEIGLQLCHQK
jgi:hypothetical protein